MVKIEVILIVPSPDTERGNETQIFDTYNRKGQNRKQKSKRQKKTIKKKQINLNKKHPYEAKIVICTR